MFFGSARTFSILLLLLPAARPAVLPRRNFAVKIRDDSQSASAPATAVAAPATVDPAPATAVTVSASLATTVAASASPAPASASPATAAPPSVTTEVQDGQTGTLMALPAQITDAGLKQIPDADHPFIAPGPDDQRGPCPAMNVLANHGYISRNGITTFEEVVNGMMEGFNMEVHFAAGLAATNFVSRGNAFVNKISIGGESPLVPPSPGNIDGPTTGGIAKHGRFEGDASMSRADALVGNNRAFQQPVFNLNLLELGKLGDDGVDGNNTVLNVQTLIGMEKRLFATDQASNPKFEFAARRMFAAYGQAAFLMTVFANGTTNQTTLPILDSFFRNETFPPNWYRAAVPITGATNAKVSGAILAGIPENVPGRNNEQGVFVADPPPPPPFNSSLPCAGYFDQAGNTPATLVNTTGIFKQNVDFLVNILFAGASANPGCTQLQEPFGPAGV
ncbi:Cloroperoxidase [Mycena venus]|uniref:Cloroperoxidase n=1 Tax=Mycena venus TaxID=2733690 RepID=A0A8H6X3Y9_9AGAR|nr:Cloroperoxidase [Mycena venus]